MAKKAKAPKPPPPVEYPYDFPVALQLSEFLLSDYLTTFIETNKLADFSLISEYVSDKAFYFSSIEFVQRLTELYHDADEEDPFTYEEVKTKLEQEQSLLINRSALAKEAKRDLTKDPTNHVYQYSLYKALYESHFFDDESSKPLEIEELDYSVTERKFSPLYLFQTFDSVLVDRISRLFDPGDRTIVSEVLDYLRGTSRYAAYEFYFKACQIRLSQKV